MTDFTGPVRVRALDSDVTAVALGGAGSAQFTGSVSADGAIRSGAGRVLMTQEATLAANNSAAASGGTQLFSVPLGARVRDFAITQLEGLVCADTDLTIQIGTSGDANAFATFAVSGSTGPKITRLNDGAVTNVCSRAMDSMPGGGVFAAIAQSSGSAAEALLFSIDYAR